MLLFNICTDQGTLEKTEAALSPGKDDGHPLLDQSEQGKPVGECNTSKRCHNKQGMLIGEVILLWVANIVLCAI